MVLMKKSQLATAIALIIGCNASLTAQAQVFPAALDLADLDGVNGFALNGAAANDFSGTSVSAAGDINGDGIDDLIIGANGASPNGSFSGRSYVVFGSDSGLPDPFELSTLNGSNGFVINGEAAQDNAGRSVSAAGDVNDDGIDDLIIGAPGADPNGNESGRSYVIFGSDGTLPNPFDLSSLDGSNGFVLNGETQGDSSGRSVSGAGDFNGDGIGDLIIGAASADPNGSYSGRSYLVLGSDGGLPNPFELSGLNALNGFWLNGQAEFDFAGNSVSAAGDINGDGIDDLIVAAYGAVPNRSSPGRSYVIFGSDGALPNPIDLGSLNGSNGFVLNGEGQSDSSGRSVSGAGDINGDGIADLIIGAPEADPNGTDSGRSYVVFGSDGSLPNPFELSGLNGSNGFVINGEAADDGFGVSVSAAGDINADGIDDLVIGADFADANGSASGRSYVIFGSKAALPTPFELSSLNGSNGFVINGEAEGDLSGRSVSAAGDINGDGIDDLIIGARYADPSGSSSGRSYVVFGRGDSVFSDRFEDE